MPATTKAQTAKNAAAETFTDAQGEDPGQLAQVLAALNGLTAKFAGVETTVSDLAARQDACAGGNAQSASNRDIPVRARDRGPDRIQAGANSSARGKARARARVSQDSSQDSSSSGGGGRSGGGADGGG